MLRLVPTGIHPFNVRQNLLIGIKNVSLGEMWLMRIRIRPTTVALHYTSPLCTHTVSQ